ncbi:hypothetical protein ACTXT7_017006, partial [Hymenolepis weldensis]
MAKPPQTLYEAISQNDVVSIDPSFFRNNPTTTPLIMAVNAKLYDIIFLLLQYGADITGVDDFGQTALHHAVEINDMRSVAILLSRNCPIDVKDNSGFTPLVLAIRNNNIQLVRYFVKNGAMVYPGVGSFQSAPLGTAAYFGLLDILQFLLNVKEPDELKKKMHMNYALCMASDRGNTETAQFLIDHGTQVSRWNNSNNSPLHFAVASDHREIVSLLLSKGAPVNDQCVAGLTPLMHAALFDSPFAATMLLWYGADPDAVATDGQTTAETIARILGRKTIEQILFSWKYEVITSML